MKGQELNLFAVQKSVEEHLKKPQSKRDVLLFQQYLVRSFSKLLLLYTAQYGIYIVPQLENIEEWHGIVFVRHGLYKDGRFKFQCSFRDFPAQPPKISFVSELYHPMVSEQTGELDLKTLLNNRWNYGTENLLCQVFERVKSIFTDVRRLEEAKSFNPRAYELFKSNVQDFYVKVLSCVEKSKQSLYDNYENTSLRLTEPSTQHQRIAQELSSICSRQNLSLEQKKKQFLKYVLQ